MQDRFEYEMRTRNGLGGMKPTNLFGSVEAVADVTVGAVVQEFVGNDLLASTLALYSPR